MSRWAFEIENEFETFEVIPLGENTLKWEREDDRLFDFKKSISSLTFAGDDYQKFRLYEDTLHCAEQTLRVYQYCGLVRKQRFEAKFSMASGKWDNDKCSVTFSIKEPDKYLCVKRKKEHNIFDLIKPNVSVDWGIKITAEFQTCGFQGQIDCDNPFFEDNHYGVFGGMNVMGNVTATYVRYVLYSENFIRDEFDGWIYIGYEYNQYKYVKKYDREFPGLLQLIGYEFANSDFPWLITNVGQIDKVLRNGFKLYDVLNSLLSENCPDLKIVSDFFQWNPTFASDNNYVTGTLSNIKFLKIFQKSDIKRPNSTNPANKGEINFVKLLNDILKIFNCGYFISGNTLRIEHISWFDKEENLDLVQIANNTDQSLRGTRTYSYDKAKLPKFEKFEWMDDSSREFNGEPIWYDSACVEDDEDLAETLTNRIENITTDILHCFINSSSENSDVTDKGFVIIATDPNNKVLWLPNLIEEGGSLPNNILSWPRLQLDFWQHGRILLNGYMNVAEDDEDAQITTFKSTIPIKDQDPFPIRLCCDNISEFNPMNLQNSTLGWGEVKSAELNFKTDIMQIELMFKQEE